MEQAGSGGKTETLLRDVLRACPNHVVTLNNLALLLEDAGRLKEAETYYRRTTVADPKSPAPWAGLGDVHTAQADATVHVQNDFRRRVSVMNLVDSHPAHVGQGFNVRIGRNHCHFAIAVA